MRYLTQPLAVSTNNIVLIFLCATILMGCGSPFRNQVANERVNIVDNPLHLNSTQECVTPRTSVARTTEYKQTNGLDAICASYAYDAGYTGKNQTVAVLDTPFFTNHSEFIDDDNSSPFITGYNASSNSTNISCSTTCSTAKTYHGTHVAGIIGARKNTISGTNASSNIHGVAYDANIKPITIFDSNGDDDTTSATLASAIDAGSDASIIAMNNSWGKQEKSCISYKGNNYYYLRAPGTDFIEASNCGIVNYQPLTTELTAWKNAVAKGTIVVFANGNHGLNSETGMVKLYNDKDFEKNNEADKVISATELLGDNANIAGYEASYPAKYEDELKGKWISVIAVDDSHKITSFSNGCGASKNYCIAAPGNTILGPISTTQTLQIIKTNSWGLVSGTSQAAPHVSGAIALLKQAYPSMSGEEIVTLILDTATDLGAPGTDNVYGRGMLNLYNAIQPQGGTSAVTTNNQSLDVPINGTTLTLANHFGTQIQAIEIGMRDNYNRTFIVSPTKTNRAPITLTLDDYMHEFASASQTETYALTPQATLNYQADEQETWMNLIYDYGNITASLAFHDNLQPQIFTDNPDESKMLRAFAIRPAGTHIAQMNLAHRLNQSITLSSYVARGNYDTGHDFNELGTDINYKTDHITLNIGIGHLREYQQFLGTQGTGAYALDSATLSRFTDINLNHKFHANSRFSLFMQYALYQTYVDMRYQQFAEIQNLKADYSTIGITGTNIINDDDNLTISLNTPLGVTDGALLQYTVLGYDADGNYNNVSNHYDLAVDNRHQQISINYQGALQNQGERNVSILWHHRFFTAITIDNHFQHQQNLTQISIISGISVDF